MKNPDDIARLEDSRRLPVIFVHSSLDDAGLTLYAFRVYCHIARRAGERGAFPSLAAICNACKMCRRTAMKAIRELLDRHMITRKSRTGYTSVYHLTPHELWQPGASDAPSACHVPSAPDALGGGACHAPGGGAPEAPLRISKKVIQEGNLKTCAVQVENGLDQASGFYLAYPRKLGKPAALRAINAALKVAPAEAIASGLLAWCEYWRVTETDQRFIPHASTWFNQRRWEDRPPPVKPAAGLAGRMATASTTTEDLQDF